MSDHVYKFVELVGSSTISIDDAIRRAVETAAKTLRHIDWFEVIQTRGHVADDKVGHFQGFCRISGARFKVGVIGR